MTTESRKLFGYTDTEAELLRELFDGLYAFISSDPAWEQRLPFALSTAPFNLEHHGNLVQFSVRLETFFSKYENRSVFQLGFDHPIQGTEKERWKSVGAGFTLSRGTKEKVAADIIAYKDNLKLVQDMLYKSYYGAFYDS